MARAKATSVAAYIAAQPPATRAALKRVRAAMRRAIPGAEEAISYGVPAIKLRGRVVIYYAGWPRHWSLYGPGMGAVRERFARELAGHAFSRGTIRFPLSEPVPEKLIERIAKFRAKEVAPR